MTSMHSGAARPEGRIVATGDGARHVLVHAGSDPGAAADHVILVPPFAEEMNKARRSFALLAHRLSRAGRTVWLPDLAGTGESDGDFGDATWERWLADVEFCRACAVAQGARSVALCGLRLGALLALDAARTAAYERLVLWQPVMSGEAFLTQFLRLKLAESMLRTNARGTSTSDLHARLEAGETLEIAGYELSASLARSVNPLRFASLAAGSDCPLHVLEVAAAASPTLSPACARAVDELRASGRLIDAIAIRGEPFWSTVEISVCEPLLARTAQLFEAAA